MRAFCQLSCLPARQARLVVSVWLGTQFWLVILTRFCRFPFGKIHNFAGKIFDMVGKLFLSPHALCHGGRNNIWKQILYTLYNFLKKNPNKISVKISVYKLASVCYSFFKAKMRKVIIKLIYFFFQLQDYTADGNARKEKHNFISTVLEIVIIRTYRKLI